MLYRIISGPYKGKICTLKRKTQLIYHDNTKSDIMWYVIERGTREMFFVDEDELEKIKLKRKEGK